MIADCPLCAECRLVQTVEFKIDTVYFGEVVAVHADEQVLDADGKPDWRQIDPLLFSFPVPSYWRLREYVTKAWDVGKNLTRHLRMTSGDYR